MVCTSIKGWGQQILSDQFLAQPETLAQGIIHHVKDCLQYISPDFILLHHDTTGWNGTRKSEEIADKILNSAVSVKTNENKIFLSDLVIRNDK